LSQAALPLTEPRSAATLSSVVLDDWLAVIFYLANNQGDVGDERQ
jgi:hypothetical protein